MVTRFCIATSSSLLPNWEKQMVVVMHKSKFVKSVWCQRWSSCVFNQSRNGEQAFDRNRWCAGS